MNIVLYGFKKSGKTTFGKILAKELRYSFLDIDYLIEEEFFQKTHKKLFFNQIYKEIGEENFRALEKEVIEKLKGIEKSVIATSGGCILDPESVKVLKSLGKMVYLNISKEELKRRIFSGQLPAFLDSKDPENSFEKIYEYRKPIYHKIADVEISDPTNEIPIIKKLIGEENGK